MPWNHQKAIEICQNSPQVVKHVVKCEKRAWSTLEAGKNKPIRYIVKTRDFKRLCEEIKEKRGFVMNPRFGLSDKTWTCGLYHPKMEKTGNISCYRGLFHVIVCYFTLLCTFWVISSCLKNVHLVHSFNTYASKLCIKKLCTSRFCEASDTYIIVFFRRYVKKYFVNNSN